MLGNFDFAARVVVGYTTRASSSRLAIVGKVRGGQLVAEDVIVLIGEYFYASNKEAEAFVGRFEQSDPRSDTSIIFAATSSNGSFGLSVNDHYQDPHEIFRVDVTHF